MTMQSNRMNRNDERNRGSHRPYGARDLRWNLFPGLRFASPWAIFAPSLREELRWLASSRVERNQLQKQKRSCDCPEVLPRTGFVQFAQLLLSGCFRAVHKDHVRCGDFPRDAYLQLKSLNFGIAIQARGKTEQILILQAPPQVAKVRVKRNRIACPLPDRKSTRLN